MSSPLPHDYPPPELPERDPWDSPPMAGGDPWTFDDVRFRARRNAFPLGVMGAIVVLGLLLLLQFGIFGSDPDELDAEELEMLAERARAVRGETSRSESGVYVSVSSEPEGALVYLNSDPVGITPLIDHPVEPGVVTLSLRKFDFVPRDTVILVDSARPGTFHFNLQVEEFGGLAAGNDGLAGPSETSGRNTEARRIQEDEAFDRTQAPPRSPLPTGRPMDSRAAPAQREGSSVSDERSEALASILAPRGTVQIIVRPWGTIYIDDVLHVRDTDVMYTASLAPGAHNVSVVHPSLGTLNETVEVVSGESHSVVFDFNKTFSVTVTSTPTFGEIFVNGRPTGFYTPQRLQLPIGRHNIDVRREGFTVVGGTRSIQIVEDISEPIAFELVQESS